MLYDGDVVLGGGRIARRGGPRRRRAASTAGPSARRVTSTRRSILALLVGIFHASLYVLIRGSAGGRLPLLVVAAILGAWAGDALADRLGFDLLTIGDFRLLAASIVAWVGIADRRRVVGRRSVPSEAAG